MRPIHVTGFGRSICKDNWGSSDVLASGGFDLTTRREPPTRLDKGIGHVGLIVSDFERSTKFYKDILGLEDQGGSSKAIFLRSGEASLVLHEKTSSMSEIHFGFQVDSPGQIDEWRGWLKRNNIQVSESAIDGDSYKSIKFRDPDNHLIEITYDKRLKTL